MKVRILYLLLIEAVTGAVLPHIATLASKRVRTIIEVFTMKTTDSAVKEPVAIVFCKLLKLLLVLLALRLELSLGQTLAVFSCFSALTVGILRSRPLGLLFKAFKLLFVQNAFDFTLLEPLLAREPARFMALWCVSIVS